MSSRAQQHGHTPRFDSGGHEARPYSGSAKDIGSVGEDFMSSRAQQHGHTPQFDSGGRKARPYSVSAAENGRTLCPPAAVMQQHGHERRADSFGAPFECRAPSLAEFHRILRSSPIQPFDFAAFGRCA